MKLGVLKLKTHFKENAMAYEKTTLWSFFVFCDYIFTLHKKEYVLNHDRRLRVENPFDALMVFAHFLKYIGIVIPDLNSNFMNDK